MPPARTDASAPQEILATRRNLAQLLVGARRAIAAIQPDSATIERHTRLGDHLLILLAARALGERRVPRDARLVRDTLAFGTGLQLRAIGKLAIVAMRTARKAAEHAEGPR